ncbi:hypothetical protein [Rhodopirellula sp. MGV]|uniref:hypothetical protein n=1 Tax=Rhodopirellula sp. MGV TaxID=2023130 RepID=UPI000B9657B4|nr:hypothetical protein [Rhodopirellula sp. MGV]OYP34100.1 hypothetical protein CGZ80_16370 [Rhodopirellula sp. MGV]PNY35613.1 hypothetical protein C2E31_17255 [Rhodopirellula baltica]
MSNLTPIAISMSTTIPEVPRELDECRIRPAKQTLKKGDRKRFRISTDRVSLIRYCLWAYVLLVIFEGALRKWIVPQLATPLLVIRDPVCLVAIYLGTRFSFGLNGFGDSLWWD